MRLKHLNRDNHIWSNIKIMIILEECWYLCLVSGFSKIDDS